MTGNAAKADVVLVAPDASVPEGVEAYLFGREAEDGEEPVAVLAIDDEAMWECAAEEGAVVLYERSTAYARDIAERLESLGTVALMAVLVTYVVGSTYNPFIYFNF